MITMKLQQQLLSSSLPHTPAAFKRLSVKLTFAANWNCDASQQGVRLSGHRLYAVHHKLRQSPAFLEAANFQRTS